MSREAAAPPTSHLFLEWGCHREACHCSHPHLQSPGSKYLLRGLETERHTVKHKKAPDLFPKELNLNLSVLLRTMEVMMSGNWRRFMDLMKI